MKILLQWASILLLLFASACGNEATEKDSSENSSKTPEQTSANAQTANASNEDGIVGDWELVGFVGDTNDNLQIDEEERKNLKAPSYKDYMTLNSDGSGLFTIAKMEGRYEAKPRENEEKNYLTWYDKANGPHKMGTIMKVTKDELHIKEPGGNGLFVWKRL